MKLLLKVKEEYTGKLQVEIAVEYDDGTRHPRVAIIDYVQRGNIPLSIEEWNTLKEWFPKEYNKMHTIIELGPK